MKVLILNRGEIALRACRSAKRAGLSPVLFVAQGDTPRRLMSEADEFFVCPGELPSESFLNLDLIRQAIAKTQVKWIYPGYGFHSENHLLADLAAEAGVGFIGPSSAIIRTMADKLSSHAFAEACGLETLKLKSDADPAESDFPILLKAVQGGGGRGNQIVHSVAELLPALLNLEQRSQHLFQDARIMRERYLPKARHVELQVMGIKGKCVVIGTRDCSVQRNYQKIIEEGEVSPLIQKKFKDLIPKVEIALSDLGYEGAGTLEFLYDIDREKIYFLEMNTRIQVEHPVTETLIHDDLIDLQFQIALNSYRGELASLREHSSGHAIEFRIYAENPRQGFFPDSGELLYLDLPALPFCRFDSCFSQGEKISPHFDPMIAKLIVSGKDRNEAISRSVDCLKRTLIHGVTTNIDLLLAILASPTFAEDQHHISWLENEFLTDYKSKTIVQPPFDAELMESWFAKSKTQTSAREGDSWKQSHRS